MSRNLFKEKNGTAPDPSESGDNPNNPQQSQRNEKPKEGDYRNVKSGVSNNEEFDDEYEIERENDLNEEQVHSVKK